MGCNMNLSYIRNFHSGLFDFVKCITHSSITVNSKWRFVFVLQNGVAQIFLTYVKDMSSVCYD